MPDEPLELLPAKVKAKREWMQQVSHRRPHCFVCPLPPSPPTLTQLPMASSCPRGDGASVLTALPACSQVKMFDGMSSSGKVVAFLAECLRPFKCEAGAVIVARGDTTSTEMYFIREGEAEVSIELDQPGFAVLGPGRAFGEAALLTEEPRNSFVVSKTTMRLYVLTKEDLQKAFADFPGPSRPTPRCSLRQVAFAAAYNFHSERRFAGFHLVRHMKRPASRLCPAGLEEVLKSPLDEQKTARLAQLEAAATAAAEAAAAEEDMMALIRDPEEPAQEVLTGGHSLWNLLPPSFGSQPRADTSLCLQVLAGYTLFEVEQDCIRRAPRDVLLGLGPQNVCIFTNEPEFRSPIAWYQYGAWSIPAILGNTTRSDKSQNILTVPLFCGVYRRAQTVGLLGQHVDLHARVGRLVAAAAAAAGAVCRPGWGASTQGEAAAAAAAHLVRNVAGGEDLPAADGNLARGLGRLCPDAGRRRR